ncbi:twin-arginine translocase TatA/TatE family subunit [Wansuia hejianensis]|uniref:Sec-independent protein translocase protein TatA n=1 Tax=Wansuia hejianensis TaxID=2763667 RepID=A0A926IP06_9FIRM|nr:twin-arginine translocase TatA/TatE family subunit [Wansuia hejianensis]MBC8591208.1 twin-arginine translocase TatA/TatE family subunit [Wansuia hejianensis]
MKLGAWELVLILGIALVIFGPAKLPELGQSMGKAIREFKGQVNKVTDDIKDDSDDKKED